MTTPLSVLIVEDSDSDAKLIARALTKASYDVKSQVVETAPQMRAALEKGMWDIIISDYSLPKFSGQAALSLVQEMGIDLPFIIVSGVIGEETAVAMMKSGAHDYVMKGDLARLAPAVNREIREAGTRRARARAEDALWKERWRLESIIEGTHVGTWELNVQSGEMVINEIWAEISGRSLAELTPVTFKKWETLFHPDDLKLSTDFLRRHFAGELGYYDIECRIQHKDGHYVWVHYRGCVSIRTSDGKPLIMFGTQTDISSRKRSEEKLQKLHLLQNIGMLAGVMAHDFNNILMGVFGNIALAKDEFPKGHPGHSLLESAEKSMNRAVLLTKRLLTFSKGGEPVKEPLSLGTLVEDVVRFDLAGVNIKQVFKQADDLWAIDADKSQIQQVVSIIVANAREAMPDGGSIQVVVENAEITEGEIVDLPQGKYVKVAFRDDGIGMDQKTLDHVFEPYFTTKQSGSGLGLATAYSIINRHGGNIGIVSKRGKGTTVTLCLPATAAPRKAKADPAAAKPAAAVPPVRGAKILVMDDEKDVRTIVVKMLTQCGFTVESTPDGHKAVEIYTRAFEARQPFDLVIVDLTMPGGFGGKEVLKNILAVDPDVKVIVSSGYADSPVMADYADHGFKAFVAKPYTKNDLRDIVNQVLGSGKASR